jgi:hypothetical protein
LAAVAEFFAEIVRIDSKGLGFAEVTQNTSQTSSETQKVTFTSQNTI